MKKEKEQDRLLCKFGDVHNPAEWDKFKYGAPSAKYEQEAEEANSVTVSIVKNPSLGRRLRINVASRKGFTEAETKRHQSAMTLLEIVVNSAEFKKRVLAKKFTTTKKTSQQIYDHIMTGEEVLQKGVDYEIDVEVVMYYKKNNVVGYTYSNVTTTWLNRYVTDDYKESGIAGNAFHEWLHKLGYGHASASDHTSVPYALGYLIVTMIEEYKKGARWVDLYPDVVVVNPPTVENPKPEQPTSTTPPKPAPKKVCKSYWYNPISWFKPVCYYEK